ncbi:hypothetical protein [uncultured Demequina sp.]|uniref:hypothetical protein n=1 Tax=uncultured Demequina sp. TaxID=693499 RepID=UPI0025F853F5|nr:hypothetical protein [uncultured Demequina sp.]
MSMHLGERSEARRLRSTLPPLEPEPTARRTYRAMLERQIQPVMYGWGFDGSDEQYRFPSEVWHLLVGFAPMAWSTVGAVRFEVGVLAVPREVWSQWRANEPALPEEPNPTVYYAHDATASGGLAAPLRELAGESGDVRWSVHANADPAPTAAAVLGAIRRHVLPAFAGRSEAPPIAV